MHDIIYVIMHNMLLWLQEATTSRTSDQLHGRMLELIAAGGLACRMMHETAPVTARRMSLGSSSRSDCTVQVPSPLMYTYAVVPPSVPALELRILPPCIL